MALAGGPRKTAPVMKIRAQPATRDLIAPELVGAFQSMLSHALHSTFVVGTIVSVLALLSVALMPSIRLTRTVEDS